MTRKKLSKLEFINRAKSIHGEKYDYSKTMYEGYRKKITIICPIHGEFEQRVLSHLQGKGCPLCGKEKNFLNVYGVGVNDLREGVRVGGKINKAYQTWASMIQRCYDKKYQKKEPAYIGCVVCKEWLTYSNYKKWHEENYIEGFTLDKDILSKNNKIYSPDRCCFVPGRINRLFEKRKNNRGDYYIGVVKNKNCYVAQLSMHGNHWYKQFKTEKEAFEAYKKKKEEYIQNIAEEYRGVINDSVYNAMKSYKVEIED